VFGALDTLEPKTLAELAQAMRGNLVGVWRQPATQEQQKTQRRQKDIELEVLRGYEVARAVVERGMAAYPDDWALALALASVVHDENTFRQEVLPSTEFAGRRQAAFALFRHAADLYAGEVEQLGPEDRSDKVYSTWFHASLGACDLGAVTPTMNLATAQIGAIRDALVALPGEAADRHLELFANALFTRMGSVNPGVKFRYVSSGLEIVGEQERAAEAREVYDYYKDLVSEIRLETRVDGADRVGHGTPFGLSIDIRHTREIEREAGGFSKYLTNQNDADFSWNYGRPTENYREKFEDGVREALAEHFEILSITFNHPDTHSRADEPYGWRVTPYAYVLLKARGPEVDRVPSVHLDLDFLDTSGYVVLPVASSPLAIDAQSGSERPYRELRVTQTLDERQADKGKLLLEVKATALGLVPALDGVLDLAPEGFDVVSVDDHGVSVSEFHRESSDAVVLSERSWDVALQATPGQPALPRSFTFGAARADAAEMVHQRYVDADLERVDAVVALGGSYGERDLTPLAAWSGALLLLAGAGAYLIVRTRRGRRVVGPVERFRVPAVVSPFTVLGLLRSIEANNGVSHDARAELLSQISDLERHYFDDEHDDGNQERKPPNLQAIAERWVRRVH
jgi:hypothetical protein